MIRKAAPPDCLRHPVLWCWVVCDLQGDPAAVVLLRAMFLKLTSVLDLPLARIMQVPHLNHLESQLPSLHVPHPVQGLPPCGYPAARCGVRLTAMSFLSVGAPPPTRCCWSQAQSADVTSVANHYSSELVSFVRRVMEAIPMLVFENLKAIMALQTKMRVR
jgi:hypothetical protein